MSDLTALDERIAELRRRLAQLPAEPGGEERAQALAALGLALAERSKQLGFMAPATVAALDEAIDLLTAALEELPPGDPDRPRVAPRLGTLASLRYVAHGTRPADRDLAIGIFEQVVDDPRVDPEERELAALWLGQLLVYRVLPADAIGIFQETARGMHAGATPGLGFALTAMQAMQSPGTAADARDLDAAIGYLSGAAEAPGLPASLKPVATSLLGLAMMLRHMRGFSAGEDDGDGDSGAAGDAGGDGGGDLSQAADVLDHAVSLMEPQTPGRAEIRGLSGLLRAQQAQLPGHAADMDRAVEALTEAASALPPGHVLRGLVLDDLGVTLGLRAGHTGSLSDASTAPQRLSEALDEMDEHHPLYEATLKHLGGILVEATALNPTPAGIEQAVEQARAILGRQDAGDVVGLARDHFLLGMTLVLRAMGTGDHRDLTEAVGELRQAATLVPPDDELAPVMLATLGAVLIDRFQLRGSLEDAEVATLYMTRADEVLDARGEPGPGGDPTLLVVRSLRGYGRAIRGIRTGDAAALDGAVGDLEATVELLPPDYPFQSRVLSCLGIALIGRGALRQRFDEVRRGAVLIGEAVEAMATEVSDRPALRARGATALLLRGLLDNDVALFDQGVAMMEASVESASFLYGEPARLRFGLGSMLLSRHALTQAPGDLDAGIERLEQARGMDAEQPASTLTAALLRQLSEAYRLRSDPARDDRRNAVDTGLAALRALAEEVLLQTGSDDALAVARSAAAETLRLAAWCLEDGVPERALEALELGRGLVLHAATSATDVPSLLETAGQPALAGEWRRMATSQGSLGSWQEPAGVLAAPPGAAPAEPGPGTVSALIQGLGFLGEEPPSDLRYRVLAALRGTAAETRLLHAPPVAELAASLRACGSDALVYLFPATESAPGWALLVRAGPDADARLDQIELPELRTGAGPSWQDALDHLCDWAWPAAMGPLLGHVAGWGLGRPPRLTLVPCGTLGLVPWHAARTLPAVDGTRRYACQEAVLSYAATGRQLVDAARREWLPPDANPVLVANPAGDLLFWAASEVEAIRAAQYPHATTYGRTSGPVAGRGLPEEVLRWFPGSSESVASLLHLACHAHTGEPPTRSFLALAAPRTARQDGRQRSEPLPVARILQQALQRPPAAPGGLVVLSACVSDLADRDHDEALTLATAVLAAGAAGVVGSRWVVDNAGTPILMFMLHHGLRQGLLPADALRAAQVWMLDPGREVPGDMPQSLTDEVARTDLTAVGTWAAFTYQGR